MQSFKCRHIKYILERDKERKKELAVTSYHEILRIVEKLVEYFDFFDFFNS